MPLNEDEKVAIRHHCGYLNVAEAATFVLGTPSSVETQFIIESAMNKVLEAALPRVRNLLIVLESIEGQMIQDHELLAVEELGEIKVNTREQEKLTQRYDYWVSALCNLLGVYRNPFDKRLGSRGINASVQH